MILRDFSRADFLDFSEHKRWKNDSSLLISYNPIVHIPEYGISITEGVCCYKDDSGEWIEDFGVTFVFDSNNLDEYLYMEQDPPVTTVYNYLRSTKNVDLTYEQIEQLNIT